MSETEELTPFREGINVDLLLQVADHIREEPKRLDMSTWIQRWDPAAGGPPCGTSACIAGWAAMLAANDRSEYGGLPAGYAAEKIGLTADEEKVIFYSSRWPREFREGYANAWRGREANPFQIKAEIAAQRILHFIKTGE